MDKAPILKNKYQEQNFGRNMEGKDHFNEISGDKKNRINSRVIIIKEQSCHNNKRNSSWRKKRPVDHWNKTEDPNVNTHNHRHLIFDNDAKIC